MRPAYGSLLVPLFEEDGPRQGELARRARLSKQTLTTVARALEEIDARIAQTLSARARAPLKTARQQIADLDRRVDGPTA